MCNLQFNRNWSLFKPLALNGDVKAFGFYVPIVEEAHNVFPAFMSSLNVNAQVHSTNGLFPPLSFLSVCFSSLLLPSAPSMLCLGPRGEA